MAMKTLMNSFPVHVCRSEINDSLVLIKQTQSVYFSGIGKQSATEDVTDLCRKQLS